MSRMIEFTTPEGPDFIDAFAIDSVRPAPDIMCRPGEAASLLQVRCRHEILVRGEARALRDGIERVRRGEVEAPITATVQPDPAPPYSPSGRTARRAEQVARAEAALQRAEQAVEAVRAERN